MENITLELKTNHKTPVNLSISTEDMILHCLPLGEKLIERGSNHWHFDDIKICSCYKFSDANLYHFELH